MSEQEPSQVPACPRHRPGRGDEVSDAERREIHRVRLTEGLTQTALAERFGRTRDTIRKALAHPSFKALEESLNAEVADEARTVLRAGRVAAAQTWVQSMGKAAAKGDHRPARDLLVSTNTIPPVGTPGDGGPKVVIVMGNPSSGDPVPAFEIIEVQREPSADPMPPQRIPEPARDESEPL